MKRTVFGGLAVLVSLATGSSVNAQYNSPQQTLLPNYPSATTAYPLNQPGIPAQQVRYRQDQVPAPGPQDQVTPTPAVQNYSPAVQNGTNHGVNQGGCVNGSQGGVVYQNGPVYQGGPVDIYAQGSGYGGYANNGCGGSYIDSYNHGYVNPGAYGSYGAPVYNSVVAPSHSAGYGYAGGCATGGCGGAGAIGSGRLGGGVAQAIGSGNRNWVFGIRGLIFHRDYEDDRGLSYNPSNDYLFSTDADVGTIGGVEGFVGSRNCNGFGWEGRYWGLFPSDGDATLVGSPAYTTLIGLNYLDFGPNNVRQIYDSGTSHRIYRNNEIHNIEFNVLRNAGCMKGWCGRNVNVELLAGVRFFRFDESFRYSTFTGAAGYPSEFHYDLEVENDMVGIQFGARSEHCLSQKLALNIGTKVGVYNNSIYHRQFIHDGSLNYATVNTGPYATQDYSVSANKDDVAFLGELDFGLSYQVGCRTRLSIGYRAVAVSGVALATDQIPYNFADLQDAGRIDSNGSLILHGGYAGVDFCF